MIRQFLKSKRVLSTSLALLLGAAGSASVSADYTQHPLAEAFVERMVTEHKYDRDTVIKLLAEAKKQQSILDAISRPAEKSKQWHEYRKIFLGEKRIQQGVDFWLENRDTIARASEKFGVAPEIIVAIIGVETRYGRHAGRYRVLDALATLGFDYPKRAKFFRKELEHYLLLVKEQNQDPLALKGSYAGAMGYGQFISSSYRHYAVDFDGDDVADIWNNPVDAIGSVANYFNAHRWKTGKPVVARAKIAEGYDAEILNSRAKPALTLKEVKQKGFTLAAPVADIAADDVEKVLPLLYHGEKGKEFWLGFDNFYVITRYNRSRLYAMAVWQLSQEISGRYAKQSAAKTSAKGS